MVRNITGSLLEVGMGKRPPEWIAELLAAKDRTKAAPTAKPEGLYLVGVDYPAEFGIPQSAPGPLFLPDPLVNSLS
jgi:tRNA pseudouridine38-40 synthase